MTYGGDIFNYFPENKLTKVTAVQTITATARQSPRVSTSLQFGVIGVGDFHISPEIKSSLFFPKFCDLFIIKSNDFGVVNDGFFWRFRWLHPRKLQRCGKQYYMTICYPLSADLTVCKIYDLKWPWVAISCRNPFSASTSWIRAFECQKIIQPVRICSVLCIARSVSQPR